MSNDILSQLLGEKAHEVGIAWGEDSYSTPPPFSPIILSPEYRKIYGGQTSNESDTSVYGTVRESLRLMGLDSEHYGTENWNPLGLLIRPGDTVVLKPNFVREFRESYPDHADCITTHGSVIRAVIDYVYIAIEGNGRIIVADSPQNDADFSKLIEISHLDSIVTFYKENLNFTLEISDLRHEIAHKIKGVIVDHLKCTGDKLGYVKVNLGDRSAFHEVESSCHMLYGTEYDRSEIIKHHTNGAHEYLVSKTILDADCVISIPKLKTHKKTGVTVNLKNLVGINGNKNWLPHHREGTPSQGGDQFAEDNSKRKVEMAVTQVFKKTFPFLGRLRPLIAGPIKSLGNSLFGDTNTDTIRSGNWYGNDTTWRMVLDLNRILYYSDSSGKLHSKPIRKFFSIVDGIIGGEGNGPLDPTPKPCGLIISGINPVAVDLAATRLMDFDYTKIPLLLRALETNHQMPLVNFSYDNIKCHSNSAKSDKPLSLFSDSFLNFTPHFGWTNHIELVNNS